MDNLAPGATLWAKTGEDEPKYHPLILHLLDVGAAADAILSREPLTTRERMAAVLGLSWMQARPWLLALIASHDLGKACPGFQAKWAYGRTLVTASGLSLPMGVDTHVNHAFVSQIALNNLLLSRGWPGDLAEQVADAVGCHHGVRATPLKLEGLLFNRKALGDKQWMDLRAGLFEELCSFFEVADVPSKENLSGPDFMLLAGLASFADWIGSNQAWFPFGIPEECTNINAWWQRRRAGAELALDAIGWQQRVPLCSTPQVFQQVFNFAPRPLQNAVATIVKEVSQPCILLVEAPMGEGKTEAAFYAHLELQRRFGHRGLYVAMPTKATGNAMFARTLAFIKSFSDERNLDLQLLHGSTLLNETFQELRNAGIHSEEGGGSVRAAEWFTNKKRALLSEYGVGTVDQALLSILPVRHQFVRIWGLANRVVVFDEVHAYDAYTGGLLIYLVEWLLALGSSVVMLSATLPSSFRRKLAHRLKAPVPEPETTYPRVTVFQQGVVSQRTFMFDAVGRRSVRIAGIPSDLESMRTALCLQLQDGGLGMALVNTVQRAQELYQLFSAGTLLERGEYSVGKLLPDGTQVFLFHARFPSDSRQAREDMVLQTFGKNSERQGRKILIATQVAEQSLDLDFDTIVSDLAPIDLLLQRAGRLWRHPRAKRPMLAPCFTIAGLEGDLPPSFDGPLWWNAVYGEDVLLRTWCLLRSRTELRLPADIDELVQMVYEDRGIIIPEELRSRFNQASTMADGEAAASRCLANNAIIGFPDDNSWNDPARFVKGDEDEPGLSEALIAQTRLGKQAVLIVPLSPMLHFSTKRKVDFLHAQYLFQKTLSISRANIVASLTKNGVPQEWRESPLLRNCYPMLLDDAGRWLGDLAVRLDDNLGLVYESKKVP